jgi:putative aldouronate transport system substrate-binding protein
MKTRRILVLGITFLLCILPLHLLFAGGGKPEEAAMDEYTNDRARLPLTQEPVTIDYFMSNHRTKPFTVDDLTFAELQRQTNVYFNIISVDSGYWDKYEIMLSANALPDLVFTTVAKAKNSGIEGTFAPLDELLEEHGSHVMQAIDEERIKEDVRALDGKMYFFPKIALQQPEPFMVRQDWLEKYDIETPDTIDDIYQMLKIFKERDPAGDGKTIPYGSMMYADPSICYLNSFYRAFGVDQDFMLKDGRMIWGPAQPGMREAMTYLNRLYAEELLDNEAPILAKKQWEERVSAGRVGMIVYSPVRADFFTDVLSRTDPEAKMVGIRPPKGIDGKRHTPPMPRFSPAFCMTLTRDSQYGELITRFFDYVFSPEGRMVVSYGVEGDSYEMINGKPVFAEKMYVEEDGWNLFVKAAIGGRRISSWPYDEAMLQQYKGTLALDAINLSAPYLDPPTPLLNFDESEMYIIERMYNGILDSTYKYLLKFLVGELSVDDTWNEYIEVLKRAGLDDLETAYNAAYARRYQ